MKRLTVFALSTLVLALATPALASPLSLSCPGGLSDQSANSALTFGGAGIPKNAVCMGVFGNLTLVLNATQRLSNPAVTNNGVDTSFAGIGDDTANGQPQYGIWNFDWAVFNASTSTSYKVTLSWDTDPGAGTDTAQFGFLTSALGPGQSSQDSWNLGMGFIDTGVATPTYKPAAGLYSPYAGGVYGFKLTAVGTDLTTSTIAMEVSVGLSAVGTAAVPEPSSLVLMGTGFLGLAAFVRRRQRKA